MCAKYGTVEFLQILVLEGMEERWVVLKYERNIWQFTTTVKIFIVSEARYCVKEDHSIRSDTKTCSKMRRRLDQRMRKRTSSTRECLSVSN